MVKLCKNKRIGNVIFIVEGEKTEPRIIRNIFKNVLCYNVYQYNKPEDIIRLKSDKNIYDKVTIITNDKPQLSCVLNETEFVNKALELLNKNNLDVYDSAIYYIFDRDYGSNSYETIIKLMDKFNNSRESADYEVLHGLLLLSYPCIESFYMNSFSDNKRLGSSKEIKTYVNLNKYKSIDENKIMVATDNLLNILNEIFKIEELANNLDDFKIVNKKILEIEEKSYKENSVFITLSLLSVALIDLGIIQIDWIWIIWKGLIKTI